MITVLQVKPLDNYSLKIKLSNGKSGIFDVSPYLEKGIFKELKDKEYFKKVKPLFCGISWPNNQDFSADTLEFLMTADNENKSSHTLNKVAETKATYTIDE